MERFHSLIFALAALFVLPWFIYAMILLWEYKEWIAMLLIIAFIYIAIKLLQVFDAWQKAKIGIMIAKMEKEQLMSAVISEGEIVALVLDGWNIEHLSAEHERAKAFASTRFNIKEEVSQEGPKADRETILELLSVGMQVHDVAMRSNVSPKEVIQIGKEANLLPEKL